MAGIVEEINRLVSIGTRLQVRVMRGWQRGSQWTASLGDLTVRGRNQAEALDRLAEQIEALAGRAYDKGYAVQHEDGSVTICQWFGMTVSQTRLRDGRVSVTSSGPWASPKEAAEAAVRPESHGPGAIVRL
jgi:hypothetical protein